MRIDKPDPAAKKLPVFYQLQDFFVAGNSRTR